MNKQSMVAQFLNELWNDKNSDVSGLHSLFSEKVIVNSPLGKNLGRNFIQGVNQKWLKAFPGMEISSIEYVTDRNRVGTTWMIEATHEGFFNDCEPTGKSVKYRGSTFFTFEDKKVTDYEAFIDLNHIYAQLGFFLDKEKYNRQSQIRNSKTLLIETVKAISTGVSVLTDQEIVCLCFWVSGRTAKEIGQTLSISHRTVQSHISNVMDKMSCHSKRELTDFLYDKGVIHILWDLQALFR